MFVLITDVIGTDSDSSEMATMRSNQRSSGTSSNSTLQVTGRETRAHSVGNCLGLLAAPEQLQIEGGSGYNRARRRSTRHLDQLQQQAINYNQWANRK